MRLARIQQHLDGHLKNAIIFEDKRICRCHLPCRSEGHYHCPFCMKTILRRNSMECHLKICSKSAFEPSHSLLFPALESSLDLPVMAQEPSHNIPLPVQEPSPANELGPENGSKKRNTTKCPHCSLDLLKKNLDTHILRRHADLVSQDVTLLSHLSSICVDVSNGVSVVQRTGHGFSVPVHVQRKTTGNIHHVKCELEECCQFHLLAQRSGLPFSQCEHLRSLDYCHDTAFEDILNPIVLDEMVALKFFGNEKKAVCLKRQKAAQAACVPFSVLVEFGGSNKQITLSIHEPTIHFYSRLGRVMVCYNLTDGTWHCPCAKACTSCTHKNIGKWHLFQINRDLFKTGPSKSADAQTIQGGIYVPNIDLQRSVQYVFDEKKIPAFLPDEISKPKSLLEYPTQLCPVETTCAFCSEQTVLEMPLLVTKKAKIATMAGVMHDVWVYTRRCPVCHVLYRYREWQDGLHNFDNHLFLSLELCLYL
ncbi:uncharacterized protein LOC120524899 [Polypterus senegalus]|uniref:uncharacterized protein LOC120524899 n=1 Tax=Polypterus senegalus TaxID=55291 RepID=UPI0019658FA1|nr:uncharacterized protein LOC120524899 [Polypterus senegalus]XP_039602670.1 uncharacterized protein LOC120524899 [Polypterus senegalus]XP_039602671.1 uncharacterized protein LOC120524899 [Polypterus senegalus]